MIAPHNKGATPPLPQARSSTARMFVTFSLGVEMSSRVFLRSLVSCFVGLLVACGSAEPPPVAEPSIDPQSVELRVMSFNIEWGGANISFENVAKAIRLSGADVVGIQEAEGNLKRLANDLGWHYDLRNYVISRFPLIDPPGADGLYVLVEVEPGRVIAIANTHLPSDPYGPDQVRDGATAEDVLALERRVRLPKIEPYLAALPLLFYAGIPVYLTGDFNAPSHTDWIAETVGTHRFVKYPMDWPVSKAVAATGLKDSWREVHPDPVANPGLTWFAGRPPLELYSPGDNDPLDRIDFLWFAGPQTVLSSEIAGEEDGPEVTFGVSPWPSDHRAVISAFSVLPAAMPEFVSPSLRVYREGQSINIAYNVQTATELGIFKSTERAESSNVAERLVTGRGDEVFDAETFSPGHYFAVVNNQKNSPIKTEFWVLDREADPEVTVIGNRFKVGDAIPVEWRNAPGNRNDYLAAYKLNVAADYDNGQAWSYVKSMPEGQAQLSEATAEWSWPLEPGDYVVRLIKDDGQEPMAESQPFTIE